MEHGLWTSVFSSVFPPICPVLVCMGLTAAEKPLFLFFALGAVFYVVRVLVGSEGCFCRSQPPFLFYSVFCVKFSECIDK